MLAAQWADCRGDAFIPFLPTIPAVVRVSTVLIIISVLPIVFAVIGDQIVEREAVVGRYIIHTLESVISVGAAVWKQIIAAIDTSHHLGNHPGVAFNKTADVVSKTPVPLEPSQAGKAAPELISGSVPRLRDQTHPA